MKRETKYTLISLPATYLLLVLVSIFISAVLDGGRCGEFAAFSYPRECGAGELVYSSFYNAFLLSIYLFPVYIVLPTITFFVTKHFRIKHEAVSAEQPGIIPQKSKQWILWMALGVVVLFVLYFWARAIGFFGTGLNPKNSQQVEVTPPQQNQNQNFQNLSEKPVITNVTGSAITGKTEPNYLVWAYTVGESCLTRNTMATYGTAKADAVGSFTINIPSVAKEGQTTIVVAAFPEDSAYGKSGLGGSDACFPSSNLSDPTTFTIQRPVSLDSTVDWKVYSSNYGFKFKYPANWYNDGNYFSPQPVEYFDDGRVKASVVYEMIKTSQFDNSSIKYQIDNMKRTAPDSNVQIAGKDFQKYELEDYGYESPTPIHFISYISPKLTISGTDYYLVFRWLEKPTFSVIVGNDPAIFEQMVSTLKFY